MRTTSPIMHVATLAVTSAHAEPLCAWLEEEWSIQPVQLEKPGDRRVWVEAYFATPAEAATVARAARGRRGVASATTRVCAPRDWLSFWRHHFHVQDIGRRLRVCPVWEKRQGRAPGRRTLWVDPGASFGTGDHFTTRFCLEMIDRLCQKSPPRSLLDVGTGSGILAIAAAKLGCPRVVGTENDPLALRQAVRNVRLNRVTGRVHLLLADLQSEALRGRFEVVAANLVSGLLMEQAGPLLAAGRRWLILSGIREMEADAVAETFLARGAREVVRDGDGEWVGLMLETGERR